VRKGFRKDGERSDVGTNGKGLYGTERHTGDVRGRKGNNAI